MVVLVTCKNEEVPIKNGDTRVLTTLYIAFLDAQGQLTPQSVPSVPYVLVTETSSRSIGLEDVCDTCCRRFTSKQTFAARHKNVLAQRPCQHLAETLK